jgi:caffeoyl-CoA O-methyltransferase
LNNPISDLQTQLEDYTASLFAPEDDVLRWIRAETEANDLPVINIRAYDGRVLQFLMTAITARTVVEIGTLAGYSAIWMGRALPPDGKLYTIEKSSKHAQIARASFQRAGLDKKIELREGAASDWLPKLSAQGPFDFVFIDADKEGYPDYLNWAVENLRLGGIVAAHNAFRHGAVLAPKTDEDRGMHDFNKLLASDPRLESMILAVGDGMAAGIKKS